MFRPPSLLAPQIVPTAAILPQGSRGFYVQAHRALLPPHAPDMLTVRIQAIDGTGTCTLLDSQPCRLLRFPVLRSPVCFASKLMGPIMLRQLSASAGRLRISDEADMPFLLFARAATPSNRCSTALDVDGAKPSLRRSSCPREPLRSAGLAKVETRRVPSPNLLKSLAGATGLEPAASGVTGRRSKPTELRPRGQLRT
jgi:hypothetical protein